MIFKESISKDMEYRYVKKNIWISVAQSQAFCTIGSMHINVERKRELDSTEFWASKFRVLFREKTVIGEGNGLEGKRIC